MKVRHNDGDLERLEQELRFTAGFSTAVVKAFRKRMGFIRAAGDQRDIRNWKSLHFEQLKGRPGEHSIRLDMQFRLILRFEGKGAEQTVVILSVEDYH